MNRPAARFETVRTISRGVDVAPSFRRGLGITFMLALVGSGARLVIPIIVQQSIDKGLRPGQIDIGFITKLGVIGAISVFISAYALRLSAMRLGVRAEEGLYTLRIKLFDHIHRLSLADHNEERRGALVSRVTSDIETLTQFFSWGGLAWLLDGSQILAVSIVMVAYDWRLALVAFVVAAPLLFVLKAVQQRLVQAYNLTRERNATLLGLVAELFAGSETLRVYNASDHMVGRVSVSVKKRADSNIRAGFIGAFLFPSGEVFSVFTVVAVITCGIIIGPTGGLTAGALVGFVFLTFRFLEPIAEFTEVIDHTQTAVAGLRRVLSVLDTPIGPPAPEFPLPLPAGTLSVQVKNVSFSYGSRLDSQDDDLPVLSEVNFSIPAGQHIALVGESGSGKTTLARLIARLADPTMGEIYLGGVLVKRVANEDLRTRLTVVPQEPFLFSETIRYNLRFAVPSASDKDLLSAISELQLIDWFDVLPSGLDTHVGQRGGALSAGERQLVALIRAFLVRPDILILDEATSAVDALTEVRISRAFDRVSAGRTTISIAHRLSTAARADRIIVLEHGRIVEDGSHHELLSNDRQYGRMYAAWLASTNTESEVRGV
ncbi:MAG: ABC transporter ATP-binding protein [Ilumatobacteraceae bacterium]